MNGQKLKDFIYNIIFLLIFNTFWPSSVIFQASQFLLRPILNHVFICNNFYYCNMAIIGYFQPSQFCWGINWNFLQVIYHPTLLGFDVLNVLWINSDLMVLKLELDCMFTVFDSLTRLRTLLITNHLVCQVLQHISIFCDFAQYSQF